MDPRESARMVLGNITKLSYPVLIAREEVMQKEVPPCIGGTHCRARGGASYQAFRQ